MKKDDKALESQLGKNLKAEKERLKMSTSEMAYHCQTSTVTIWNWETGKAKIPLNAIAKLTSHGFDPGNILPVPKTEKVHLTFVGDEGESAIGIERHLLARCDPALNELQDWECMRIYHNLDWISASHPIVLGSLCLVDVRYVQRFEGDRKDLWTGTFLLRAPASEQYSLAEFEPMSKNMVRIKAGEVVEKASLQEVHRSFPAEIQGKVLGTVGYKAPQNLSSNWHGRALPTIAKAIRGRK